MTQEPTPQSPPDLKIEYQIIKRMRLPFLLLVILILFLTAAKGWTDSTLLGISAIVLIVYIYLIRKAFFKTALIVSAHGISVHGKRHLAWSDIANFYLYIKKGANNGEYSDESGAVEMSVVVTQGSSPNLIAKIILVFYISIW